MQRASQMSATKLHTPFCGTYKPDDVHFLLCEVEGELVDAAAKEALMQSGQKHYSELISLENPPSTEYMKIFEETMIKGGPRMASDVASVALALQKDLQGTF